ncbi:MAG: PLP-dependent aminotransferase family protein [Planctomycetaceae bacterium]|nr:PLP-dependent aminotransferase family protein [Planctomycetaceae bacterium]
MKRTLWATLALDRRQPATLQDQLSSSLREAIQTGSISSGTMLPSTRELASELAISRNTVIAAYDRLMGEGYLESKPRSGIMVREGLGSFGIAVAPTSKTDSRLSLKRRLKFEVPLPKPFHPCQPDVNLFPMSMWNRMRNRVLRRYGAGLLHYQSSFALGWPELRHALAEYLRSNRGVQCGWQNIAITSGSQQALFLLGQLLLKRSSVVACENPGYVGARAAFLHAGAKLRLLPVDELGVVPPQKTGQVDLVYATPSRQFPTGATLPVARRTALLEYIQRAGAWMVEDDYDSEFRYTRPPLPSLHSLDRSGRVIYLGTMSKVLLPTLRIGYLVLPDSLVAGFESLRLVTEDHGPMIDQATLAEFLLQGGFYSHIRRCRKNYAKRLEVFLRVAEQLRLPLEFRFTDGGMNQTGLFHDSSTDDVAVSKALSQAGLDVRALSHYSSNTKQYRPGLVFGFTAFSPATIRNSLKVVAQVLEKFA